MGDYRKLWQELGMELEKHDMLCEALPPLYEKVYLTQQNRPEAMGYFDFVISEIHGARVEELAVHNRAGGKIVGTFCVFVPTEIIQAAGGIAVGLCGGSQFWVPDGEKVLPRNLCPLIKGSVGAKISGTCPYFQFCDLLVGETTCDGKKKAWEVLGEYMPIHVMDLPQMKREKDYTAWRDEINIFVNKLEELTGNKINAENLAAAIKTDNARRQALSRLYEARKADPVPISGKDALLISQIAFYDDPVRFADKTNEVCVELEARIAAGEGVFPAGTPRLLVTGTPQAIPNWKLHHLVESAGGAIVCEETCTGTRYFDNLVNEEASGFDEQLQAGRPAEVTRFRQQLIADRLGLQTSFVPSSPADLVALIRRQVTGGGGGRIAFDALNAPNPAPSSDELLAWNPDGSPDASANPIGWITGVIAGILGSLVN